jgi:hypothetical protein
VNRIVVMALAALASIFPAGAWAQQPQGQASGPGFSLQVEVGAGWTARDLTTDTGVVWGAILGLHFVGPLGLEVEYQHAENDISGGPGTFKQDGLLGHVRLDVSTSPTLTPFVYAGLGWVHFHSNADILGLPVDRVVVPLGVGLEVSVRPIVLGARGEYQWNTSDIADKHVDFWKVVGTVGFRVP